MIRVRFQSSDELIRVERLGEVFVRPAFAPALPGVWTQPPVALHESTVHGF